MNGHPVDKIELLVLGGTWTSYPHKYQETFIRDLFYAANTFWQRPKDKRMPVNLDEEKALNESVSGTGANIVEDKIFSPVPQIHVINVLLLTVNMFSSLDLNIQKKRRE